LILLEIQHAGDEFSSYGHKGPFDGATHERAASDLSTFSRMAFLAGPLSSNTDLNSKPTLYFVPLLLQYRIEAMPIRPNCSDCTVIVAPGSGRSVVSSFAPEGDRSMQRPCTRRIEPLFCCHERKTVKSTRYRSSG